MTAWAYSVRPEDLSILVARIAASTESIEAALAGVERRVGGLHELWQGAAADAHRRSHAEWAAAARQLNSALVELEAGVRRAHGNYESATAANVAMWTVASTSGGRTS